MAPPQVLFFINSFTHSSLSILSMGCVLCGFQTMWWQQIIVYQVSRWGCQQIIVYQVSHEGGGFSTNWCMSVILVYQVSHRHWGVSHLECEMIFLVMTIPYNRFFCVSHSHVHFRYI